MTQGYIFLGVDDEDKTRNIDCAYALSLSLKLADPDCETCVVVHKFEHVPKRYEGGFDYIVELPFGRTESNHHNIFIDFWQVYYCTPFDESMYINTYTLAVDNVASLWDVRQVDDIVFASATDFRGDLTYDAGKFITQERNNIAPFKADLIYFNKEQKSSEFFKMADPFFKGWRDIYRDVLTEYKAADFEYTLMTNIVAHSLGEQYTFPAYFDYIDLEINFQYNVDDEDQADWLDSLNIWVTDDVDIKINNHRQTGVWHYGNPRVMTADIIKKLDDNYRKAKTKVKA